MRFAHASPRPDVLCMQRPRPLRWGVQCGAYQGVDTGIRQGPGRGFGPPDAQRGGARTAVWVLACGLPGGAGGVREAPVDRRRCTVGVPGLVQTTPHP